jgi:hypothetical protein
MGQYTKTDPGTGMGIAIISFSREYSEALSAIADFVNYEEYSFNVLGSSVIFNSKN